MNRNAEDNNVNLELQVVNLGLATIYAEEWGIAIHRPFSRKTDKIILYQEDEGMKLEPGKTQIISLDYSKPRVKERVSGYEHDKVKISIYMKYHLGEIFNFRKEPLSNFMYDYQKLKDDVFDKNNELSTLQLKK